MTSTGPWMRCILATGAVALTALGTVQAQSAPRWVHESGQQNWIGKTVSLGNRGTQVFAELGPAYPTRLFSTFDHNPPTPVWQVQSPELRFSHRVASSEEADVHASLYQVAAGSGLRQPMLARYASSSATPQWTYTFPFTTNSHEYMDVFVSKDGSRIVAGGWNIWNNKTDVAIFDADSPAPISYVSLNASGLFRSFLVSDDARVAYIMGNGSFKVFDLQTGAQLAAGYPPGGNVFDSHGMSGDGSVFAFGGFNSVRVWRRNASGGYSETDVYTVPGQNYCSRIAISADGSTLAASFDHYDTQLRVDVRAWDLATDALLMSDTVVGAGSLSNSSGDLAISANGSRFVLGLWGDAAGLSPEVRIYDARQNTPIMVHDLPGSALDVEISGDGRRAAVASKGVHANTAGNGGSIELFEIGAPDFEVRGTPRVGGSVVVEVRGTPGTTALLLSSPEAAIHPYSTPWLGTLYLRRSTISLQPIGTIPSSGRLTTTLPMPTTDASAGSTVYIQALTNPPRRLTRGWEAVTVLPR